MSCNYVKLPGSETPFIVCDRRRRRYCGWCRALASLQCDWKTGKTRKGQTKTCDAYLCPQHGQEVAPEKHLCPTHQAAYREWQAAGHCVRHCKP